MTVRVFCHQVHSRLDRDGALEQEHQGEEGQRPGEDVLGGRVLLDQVRRAPVGEPALDGDDLDGGDVAVPLASPRILVVHARQRGTPAQS